MADTTKKSAFEVLSAVNVNDHLEKKNGLSYLSWAWAWGTLKKYYPDSTYRIYEDSNGFLYHTDGNTAWVKVSVTVDGIENVEYLPVMDYRNRSIPLEQLTSMDANKAIQRALTKAIARAGLGLYVYAGEDLPEAEEEARKEKSKQAKAKKPEAPKPFKGGTVNSAKDFRKECLAYMKKNHPTELIKMGEKYGVNKSTTNEQWQEVYDKILAEDKLASTVEE